MCEKGALLTTDPQYLFVPSPSVCRVSEVLGCETRRLSEAFDSSPASELECDNRSDTSSDTSKSIAGMREHYVVTERYLPL